MLWLCAHSDICLAQGRVEGFVEGEAKANRENARRMKTKGYPLEVIAEVTGLSPEEVERL